MSEQQSKFEIRFTNGRCLRVAGCKIGTTHKDFGHVLYLRNAEDTRRIFQANSVFVDSSAKVDCPEEPPRQAGTPQSTQERPKFRIALKDGASFTCDGIDCLTNHLDYGCKAFTLDDKNERTFECSVESLCFMCAEEAILMDSWPAPTSSIPNSINRKLTPDGAERQQGTTWVGGVGMNDLGERIRKVEKRVEEHAQELRFALNYIESDAGSSLNKSRGVMEQLLKHIFNAEMGEDPKKPLLGEMLANNQFTRKIDRRILALINSIRDMGNLGTHLEPVKPYDATRALHDLCEVLEWYLQRYAGPSAAADSAEQPVQFWDMRLVGAVETHIQIQQIKDLSWRALAVLLEKIDKDGMIEGRRVGLEDMNPTDKTCGPYIVEACLYATAQVYGIDKIEQLNEQSDRARQSNLFYLMFLEVWNQVIGTALAPASSSQEYEQAKTELANELHTLLRPILQRKDMLSVASVDKIIFKVDWREPPYSTLTLHVDQPLFEKCPGDWFYRGALKDSCPQFYELLLSGPGIKSVMKESPYELLMGRAELAQYEVVVAHIAQALKTATGIQQVSSSDVPATANIESPEASVQTTVPPTAYTDGDWITAAIVARERAETELKKVASRAKKFSLTDSDYTSQRDTTVNLLQTRIQQLLDLHTKGGTSDDTRLDACVAKVVADILERELAEFEWQADERSQDSPLIVLRDVIKTISSRYR